MAKVYVNSPFTICHNGRARWPGEIVDGVDDATAKAWQDWGSVIVLPDNFGEWPSEYVEAPKPRRARAKDDADEQS